MKANADVDIGKIGHSFRPGLGHCTLSGGYLKLGRTASSPASVVLEKVRLIGYAEPL